MSELAQRQHRRSLILVICCTVIGAAAQILIKRGAASLGPNPTMIQTALAMLLTPSLFAGYSLYGISTILLIMALRHGELSVLYPIFSLTYVWVMVLSIVIFNEAVNPYKIVGVAIIIGGVAVLGRQK